MDLSVVNVFSLYEDTKTSDCAYSMTFLKSNGMVKNGLFVFNVTLNVSQCSELWIAPFDSVYGNLSNISIIGNINIVGLNLS